MAQSFTKHTYYKYWDGSAWQIVSFKVDNADVGESSTVRFLRPSTHTVNGKSFYNSGDQSITLYAGDIKLASNNNTTIASALSGKQSASDTLSALNTLGTGEETLGFVKKTGEHTFTLTTPVTKLGTRTGDITIANLKSDLGLGSLAYLSSLSASDVGAVPTSRTVNSKALSSNITLYGTDIAMSSSDNTTIKSAIEAAVELANGRTTTYAVTLDASYDGTLPSGYSNKNSSLNSNDDSIDLSSYVSTGLFVCADGGSYVKISDLKVGDVLYLTNTNIPDRWYAGAGFFYKLETQNLTVFAPKASPTFTGTVTMPFSSAGFVKTNANGVLSVDTSTYLTAHPTISTSTDTTDTGTLSHSGTFTAITSVTRDTNGHVTKVNTKTYTLPSDNNTWRGIKVDGTDKLTDSSTKINFAGGTNVSLSYSSGTITINATGNVMTVGSTAPTNKSTNDIWLDTSA